MFLIRSHNLDRCFRETGERAFGRDSADALFPPEGRRRPKRRERAVRRFSSDTASLAPRGRRRNLGRAAERRTRTGSRRLLRTSDRHRREAERIGGSRQGAGARRYGARQDRGAAAALPGPAFARQGRPCARLAGLGDWAVRERPAQGVGRIETSASRRTAQQRAVCGEAWRANSGGLARTFTGLFGA